MKYFILGLIKVYQMVPGDFHNYCNHYPTCSNYALDAIRIHGTFKGTLLSIKRISKCTPFTKPCIDFVKEKKDEKNTTC